MAFGMVTFASTMIRDSLELRNIRGDTSARAGETTNLME
jgi:hypothetical protein